jgi:hypothetical protein
VIRGVWLDDRNPEDRDKRLWTHPEQNWEDIDLSVMTTNRVPGSKDGRIVDFHELYWAHLMSETKAVAVLLWLYELCRKGPIMRPGINGLWWAVAIVLCLMNLSFAVLVLRGVWLFSQTSAQNILLPPYLLLLSSVVFGLLTALTWLAFRLIKWLLVFCIVGSMVGIGYLWLESAVPGGQGIPDGAEAVTLVTLPTLVALLATYLVMGKQGMRAFWCTLAVSLILCGAFVWADQHWYDRSFDQTDFVQGMALGAELALECAHGVRGPWSLPRGECGVPAALPWRRRPILPWLARQRRRSPGDQKGGCRHA